MTLLCALASSFNCTILLAVPPSSKAPRLLGALPSYWFWRVTASTGPHLLFSPSFHYPSGATGWTPPSKEAYAVLSISIPPRACQMKLGTSPRVGFLTVRSPDPSEEGESGLCSRSCADAWRLLCLSLSSSWSSSSNARAVCFVSCDSSRIISLRIDNPAKAGGLIELFILCVPCIFVQLLLIYDVELAIHPYARTATVRLQSGLRES